MVLNAVLLMTLAAVAMEKKPIEDVDLRPISLKWVWEHCSHAEHK